MGALLSVEGFQIAVTTNLTSHTNNSIMLLFNVVNVCYCIVGGRH